MFSDFQEFLTAWSYGKPPVITTSSSHGLEHFDEVIFDVTHSTQRLKENGRTGGDRSLAKKYLHSSGIFGYTGLFAECHPNPKYAYSDGDCQIPLKEVEDCINKLDNINKIISDEK